MTTIKNWNIEQTTGYKPLTDTYAEFSIAELCGGKAVEQFALELKNNWSNDYKLLTELVMVLNWKIWEHYEAGNTQLARLYDKLWREAAAYATSHLKDDELTYYYRTTD